ncbi:hypothetical protein LXA43DRAFT_1098810 [Ganoderma leucocontextum]|nr:hypothetical protein LXA43DRAFT_1098810 [Ganoderma leucocontextum]
MSSGLDTAEIIAEQYFFVTSILACRFLLNLRKSEEGCQSTEESPAYWQTVQFTPGSARTLPPFIASMGELVDIDFAHPESSSTGGSEDLEMTFADSHASDSANLPRVESATAELHGEESRIELGNMVEEVVPPTGTGTV